MSPALYPTSNVPYPALHAHSCSLTVGSCAQVQPGQENGKKSDSRFSSLLQVLVLLVAGIILALATWHMLQPPSADQLIERIHAAAESADQGSRASNLHAQKDIQEFLSRYPDHEQAERLRQLRQRLKENQDGDPATETP